MTLYDLLNEGSAALQQAGDTDGENDAKLLLFEALHLDLVHFLMDRLRPLSEQDAKVQEQIRTYRGMIAKRASRIPLQQILGSQEFMGLDFFVNEHVLIPRQDTETLVELVLQEQQGPEKKLLDLCTGSGCIAISLAVKGGYRSVTATDLSEEALKVAERNAKMHGFAMVSYRLRLNRPGIRSSSARATCSQPCPRVKPEPSISSHPTRPTFPQRSLPPWSRRCGSTSP